MSAFTFVRRHVSIECAQLTCRRIYDLADFFFTKSSRFFFLYFLFINNKQRTVGFLVEMNCLARRKMNIHVFLALLWVKYTGNWWMAYF